MRKIWLCSQQLTYHSCRRRWLAALGHPVQRRAASIAGGTRPAASCKQSTHRRCCALGAAVLAAVVQRQGSSHAPAARAGPSRNQRLDSCLCRRPSLAAACTAVQRLHVCIVLSTGRAARPQQRLHSRGRRGAAAVVAHPVDGLPALAVPGLQQVAPPSLHQSFYGCRCRRRVFIAGRNVEGRGLAARAGGL